MAKKGNTPRGMYQRESGMWYCRIAGPDGKLIRKALSPDKADAVAMLHELRKRTALQKSGLLPEVADKTQFKTFAELAQRYREHLCARNLSESALQSFDIAYKRVVLQNQIVYLADMTLAKVEDWAKRAVASGLKGQSINLYVGYIIGALRWAHDNGHIMKNALANWVAVRNNEPRKRRDFRPEEIERFFAVETDPEWRLRWLVYFNTGLRLSAGKSVCWEWVDWEERVLRLPLEHNKSRRVHEIPLSSVLYAALVARREQIGEAARGALFPRVTERTIRTRLVQRCREAGVDTSGICVHSIRHTVATTIFNNTNRNIKAVQEVLGHANPATTMRYLHVTGAEKRAAIDSLGFGTAVHSKEPQGGSAAAVADAAPMTVIA